MRYMIASVLALTLLVPTMAASQQMDGRHCWQAYKKLQQHRQGYGVWRSCREGGQGTENTRNGAGEVAQGVRSTKNTNSN